MYGNSNWTAKICAVIKGIFFIGFSIQIILGIVWMCCNFAHVQDFPASEAVLYSGVFGLLWQCPQIMYVLQLMAGFFAGYFFMQKTFPTGTLRAVWRGFALLTFPFAMQCHLALSPHSFVGSLFLVMLGFVVAAVQKGKVAGKRNLCMALLCALLLVLVSGIADKENRDVFARRGIEGNLASRFSWYTLLNDVDFWSGDLKEVTADAWWSARYCPENMELLLEAIEERTSPESAREYMGQIAKVGWQYRKPTIIRLVGWDVLGYTVTPLVVPMQLSGEAYDSYTGRNYEAMRGETPLLTKYYVNYGCWWFGIELILTVIGGGICLRMNTRRKAEGKQQSKKVTIASVVVCVLISGFFVGLLTMRGAGLMDYKWSYGINELWLVWTLLLMGKMGMCEDEMVK